MLIKRHRKSGSMGHGPALLAAMILGCGVSTQSRADVWCVLSNFVVDSYYHGGIYLHGTLNGSIPATYIVLCGVTSGASDCTTQSSDRRLAVALAAQASGHNLNVLFATVSSTSANPIPGTTTNCANCQPYMTATTIQMLN
jgi:hypothetical protein